MSFICVENVSFWYNRGLAFEKQALKNINLTVKKGEFLGIIGHTGSGKSTLIQMFNALLRPHEGRVLIDGVDINMDKKKLPSVRAKIGLVFQYPEHQIFEETVAKDVAFGPENFGLDKATVEARVKEALSAVGLDEEFYGKSPFDLSGGQKRRAAIAGVLAMKPDCLVLDEPAAGLDPRGKQEIFDRIRQMHDELGLTIVLVSHSMEDIAKYAERIVVINEGELVLEGTPKEIFANYRRLEEMGLGAPQSVYLMEKFREMGLYSGEAGIFTSDDVVREIAKMLEKRRIYDKNR